MYVCVCVLAVGDLEHSAARCNNPQCGAGFKANVEVTPIEGRCQGNDANAAGGPRLRASSLGRKCSLQAPAAAAACSGSVSFGRPLNGRAVFKMAVKMLTLNTARSLATAVRDGQRGNRSSAGGKVAQQGRGGKREALGWTIIVRVRTQIERQQSPI